MYKHYCNKTEESSGTPITYHGICGYTSQNAKEFTSVSNPSVKGVDCPKCLEKLGKAVLIVRQLYETVRA